MRVFVGVSVPQRIRKDIIAFQKEHSELNVRWVPGENLHVTLVPPWNVDEADKVIQQLHAVHFSSGACLRFRTISFGPDKPRLIWTPAVGGIEEATAFRNTILKSLHFTPEQRPYLPHITIAKVRIRDISEFKNNKLAESIDWKFEIQSFSLIQSHLTSTGAIYDEVSTFAL